MRTRTLLLWLGAALALAIINIGVWRWERLAAQGQVVLLELAPVDPRSLIQGDYMRLEYAIARGANPAPELRDGLLVVRPDQRGVGQYVRVHDERTPLAPGELLLRFRQRRHELRVGPESFFFQEGHAAVYEQARYAELRVAPSGNVLLVGLRGAQLERLGLP